jgi:putative transposase
MSKISIFPDQYYHIYNRGVNRGEIFFVPENWRFFLVRLRKYFTPEHADIITYCLLPNHYHLLIHAKSEFVSAKIMQPFGTSYTKAINKQQQRVGALFQGPFQAKLVHKNNYLLHLSRYIHLNPVTAGLVPNPEDWEYSSYREYIGQRDGILPKPEIVLSQFILKEKEAKLLEEVSLLEFASEKASLLRVKVVQTFNLKPNADQSSSMAICRMGLKSYG